MKIITKEFELHTKGRTDVIDITENLQKIISSAEMRQGSCLIFTVGSTAGITTVEYEPGLVKTDLPKLFEKLAPYNSDYAHHQTWGDDNGAAHVRSSLLGSSLTVPFVNGKLTLGTWQQVIYIDFDTRPRTRKVIVQITGE